MYPFGPGLYSYNGSTPTVYKSNLIKCSKNTQYYHDTNEL